MSPDFEDWFLLYDGVETGIEKYLAAIRAAVKKNPPAGSKWKPPSGGQSGTVTEGTQDTLAELYSRPTDVNEPIRSTFQGASQVPLYDPDPLSDDQQVTVTVNVENNVDGGGRVATDVSTET